MWRMCTYIHKNGFVEYNGTNSRSLEYARITDGLAYMFEGNE